MISTSLIFIMFQRAILMPLGIYMCITVYMHFNNVRLTMNQNTPIADDVPVANNLTIGAAIGN